MWTGQNHQGKSIHVSSTQRHNFQFISLGSTLIKLAGDWKAIWEDSMLCVSCAHPRPRAAHVGHWRPCWVSLCNPYFKVLC